MYIHYVTIDAVKYPFHETKSCLLSMDGIQHPKLKDAYLLDIGEDTKQRKWLEAEFKKYKPDPDYLVIPKNRVSTIGVHPSATFTQNVQYRRTQ